MSGKERQANPPQLIEWGVKIVPIEGETESGDHYLVKSLPHGYLVAAVDGLGHGDEAATAAKRAVATVEAYGYEPVLSLLRRCDEQLRHTRGVVMTLASFNGIDNTMTWIGVGNVEGVLVRADPQAIPERENVLLRGGVVGYQMPQLRASVLPISSGDTLIFTTDGIRDGFIEELNLGAPPQRIADDICVRFKKENDDALALVVRYVGTER